MVTPVGLILLPIMAGFLVFARRHYSWFLAAMIPFPQTAMFIIAGQGISPFYAAAVPAAVMGFVAVLGSLIRNGGAFVPFRGVETKLLAGFAGYAILITLIGPSLFQGVGVFSPRRGINDQLIQQTPLSYSISNFAQLGYLLLGFWVVVYLLSLRQLPPRILEVGIWVGLGFTFVNAVFLQVGAPFPRDLFDTIPTIYYQSGGRLRGPFAEPSVLGAFLTGSVAYLGYRAVTTTGRARTIAVIGVCVALWEYALSASGTALVGMALVVGVGIATGVWKWAVNGGHGIDKIVLLTLAALAFAIAYWSAVTSFTSGLVSDKLTSDSFADRTGADRYALDLVVQTWGAGVGLGSNRPSSLGAMLLSCVGVVGTALLVSLVAAAFMRCRRLGAPCAASAWALAGVFLAMLVGKADLATPLLWMSLGACVHFATYLGSRRQATPNQGSAAITKPRISSAP